MEKLIDEVLFVSDVARQQVSYEQFRDVVLFVQHAHHQRLVDLVKSAVGQRGSRGHAQRPAGEAPLAEKLTGAPAQNVSSSLLIWTLDSFLSFCHVQASRP